MGPFSPEKELACLRVAGSGHHSLFKEVKGRLPLWEHHRRQTHERKHTNQHTHSQPLSERVYAPDWMKTALVWQYNPGVPHHVIAVVSALFISALPLGLYNWWRDCWQHWPHVYPRPPSRLSWSRLQTNTRRFVLVRQICETQDTLISWRLLLRWDDKTAFSNSKLLTVG